MKLSNIIKSQRDKDRDIRKATNFVFSPTYCGQENFVVLSPFNPSNTIVPIARNPQFKVKFWQVSAGRYA